MVSFHDFHQRCWHLSDTLDPCLLFTLNLLQYSLVPSLFEQMLILCEEFTLCQRSLRIWIALLVFIQSELIGCSPDLKSGTAEHTLCPCFDLNFNRYFLSKCIFFIISFLSHGVFNLLTASDRDHLFRPNFEISFWCLSKVLRRLMVPLRFIILKLPHNLTLNRHILSDPWRFNIRLNHAIRLLKVWLFQANESLNCVLAYTGLKRIAAKVTWKWSWIHSSRCFLMNSSLRNRAIF